MRTRLALSAALPLVAVLAACSTSGGNASAPVPGTPTGSAKTSPSGTVQDVTTHRIDGTNQHPSHARPAPAPHRPTVQDALDTVRSYMQREIGMRDPRVSGFRWTGRDAATVEVRALTSGARLGPPTTVSVRRLSTVWFVTGALADGIRVDTASLTGRGRSPLRITGRRLDAGPWIVTVTQDRYGKDPVLADKGLVTVSSGRPDDFDQVLPFEPPTAGTGSLIISELFPSGPDVERAVVIRLAFGPAAAAGSGAALGHSH